MRVETAEGAELNTRASLRPGGVVLVEENVLDCADQSARMFSTMSDLTMLVLTDGGRERTPSSRRSG